MLKLVALLIVADGLTTALWGHGFLRWLKTWLPGFIHPFLNFFLRWPEPALRIGAVFQAVAGMALLNHFYPQSKS